MREMPGPVRAALLVATAAGLLPAASGLTLAREGSDFWRGKLATEEKLNAEAGAAIASARELELAMQKSDLDHRWQYKEKVLESDPGVMCWDHHETGLRLVHMFNFPWDEATRTLKANESDFDHDFYSRMSDLGQSGQLDPKYCVKLWKPSDLRSYVTSEYPGLWELVEGKADHPAALVDFYRLLVVHDFGGIFWQYGAEPTPEMQKRPDPFQHVMPPEDTGATLLLEQLLTQEQADAMKSSQTGKTPALRRIAAQAFSAWPRTEFLRFACKRALYNLLSIPAGTVWNIKETMGSGMFSDALDDFAKLGRAKSISVVDLEPALLPAWGAPDPAHWTMVSDKTPALMFHRSRAQMFSTRANGESGGEGGSEANGTAPAAREGYGAAVRHGKELEQAMKSRSLEDINLNRQRYGCPTFAAAKEPRIVHLFFISGPNETAEIEERQSVVALYHEMLDELRGKYCVKLWTGHTLRSYVTSEYPGLWELVQRHADRPAAIADFYRLLIVHDFGGMAWQQGAQPSRLMWKSRDDPLEPFLPPEGKSARFLLKRRIEQEKADEIAKTRKSKTGKPVPLATIAMQVFAARPYDEFLRYMCKRAIFNLITIRVRNDNDVNEAVGSGMVSAAFADFEKIGTKSDSIDLVEPEQAKTMAVEYDPSRPRAAIGKTVDPGNTTLIERGKRASRDLELMMEKNDLHRRKHVRQKYLKCHDATVLNTSGIHIVHLLYFPWNVHTQIMKSNESDFNHTFYEDLATRLQGKYCVKLWSLTDMRTYVKAEYPGLWELVEKRADRPVALVDFYRLLVVHDFGGIFWQYGSWLTPRMWRLHDPFEPFMPPEGKSARILVEKWMTQEEANTIAKKRYSRHGKPPCLRRIATQVFAALPHNEFLRFAAKRAILNLVSIKVRRDYDILETMGNGMFSEAFHDFEQLGKADGVDVVDNHHDGSTEDVNSMVKFSHTFAWRKDKGRCC